MLVFSHHLLTFQPGIQPAQLTKNWLSVSTSSLASPCPPPTLTASAAACTSAEFLVSLDTRMQKRAVECKTANCSPPIGQIILIWQNYHDF